MTNKTAIDITKELPYTIVGHSSVPKPKIHITLTAKGIKAIAEQCEDGDYIYIDIWEDITDHCNSLKYHSQITVVKPEEENLT